MQKTTKKLLRLAGETVRRLERQQLGNVHGGYESGGATAQPFTCGTCTCQSLPA